MTKVKEWTSAWETANKGNKSDKETYTCGTSDKDDKNQSVHHSGSSQQR